MKMEQTECSETSAYKIQTPGNYPEENVQLKFLINPAVSTLYLDQNAPNSMSFSNYPFGK